MGGHVAICQGLTGEAFESISHMEFATGRDSESIRQWSALGDDMAILTAYVSATTSDIIEGWRNEGSTADASGSSSDAFGIRITALTPFAPADGICAHVK